MRTIGSPSIGRHAFGAALFAFGIVTLTWHDYRDWDLLHGVVNGTTGPVFVYGAAAAQIAGGAAMQLRRTARAGALVAGGLYLVLAVLCLPPMLAAPRVYNGWNSMFEQLAVVAGALTVFGISSRPPAARTLVSLGRVLFGTCALSFGVEQAVYLSATARLVPAWIPPGTTFWAIATTLAFLLGGVALLTNRGSVVASRLLALMLMLFGVLVWVPIVAAHPSVHANWSELVETFTIAGAAWVLASALERNAHGIG
jgi:hypothetical protein